MRVHQSRDVDHGQRFSQSLTAPFSGTVGSRHCGNHTCKAQRGGTSQGSGSSGGRAELSPRGRTGNGRGREGLTASRQGFCLYSPPAEKQAGLHRDPSLRDPVRETVCHLHCDRRELSMSWQLLCGQPLSFTPSIPGPRRPWPSESDTHISTCP